VHVLPLSVSAVHNIVLSNEFITSRTGHDVGRYCFYALQTDAMPVFTHSFTLCTLSPVTYSTFFALHCAECKTALGKMYKTTAVQNDQLRCVTVCSWLASRSERGSHALMVTLLGARHSNRDLYTFDSDNIQSYVVLVRTAGLTARVWQ